MPCELVPRAGVLIVGGGLAGSAAAIKLARAGRSVVLIEKELRPHDKVCGEFLSAEALGYLAELEVDLNALGAVPIETVRLAGRFGVSEAALPFPARSLTRRRLDEELLQVAARNGVKLLRGRRVESLKSSSEEGWTAVLDDASTVYAETAFLATGKHDLRCRSRPAGPQPDLIAFKMYWRLAAEQAAALDRHVELLLYRGGYAGLQPVETGVANLCCLVRRTAFQRMGGHWRDLLQHMEKECPHLAQRLHGAEPLLARPLAISAIPYGFVREHADGVWALGDQAAVIPSFTGEGMSIALHSGTLAAEMFLAGQSPEAYQQRLHDELRRQVAVATKVSQAMVAQQTLMETAVRLWPGVLRVVSERTRIAGHAQKS